MINYYTLVRKLYNHRIFRYILVGSTTFALDIGLLFFFKLRVGLGLAEATTIAYWVSILWNFIFNRWWSFNIKEIKSLHKHALTYGILLGFNYIFTLFFVSIISRFIYFGIAKTLAVIIQTSWTYLIYKNYIFKLNPSKLERTDTI